MLSARDVTAVLCLPLLLALPQDATSTGKETRPARTPKFFLDAGQYTIKELVTKSGEYLGRTYLINLPEDPGAHTSLVEIERRLEFDAEGCEDVVSQLLYTRNWVCTPLDVRRQVYEWIFLPGARRGEVRKRTVFVPWEEVGNRPSLFSYVTTAYPLKHIDALRVVNTLRPLMQHDQTGLETITSVGNSVAVSGFRGNVTALLQMIERADQPGPRIEAGAEERMVKIEARVAALEEAAKKK